ncbi:MAG: aminotransferase class III-fold pyridoxal phosphate-dependent enzyme, partial [bacterium]
NAEKMGVYLGQRLKELLEFDIVGDVRGIGLHWTVEYVDDKKTKKTIPSKFWVAARIEKELLKNGVYLARASVDKTYIAPPLIVNKEQIDSIVEALKKSIYAVQKEYAKA